VTVIGDAMRRDPGARLHHRDVKAATAAVHLATAASVPSPTTPAPACSPRSASPRSAAPSGRLAHYSTAGEVNQLIDAVADLGVF